MFAIQLSALFVCASAFSFVCLLFGFRLRLFVYSSALNFVCLLFFLDVNDVYKLDAFLLKTISIKQSTSSPLPSLPFTVPLSLSITHSGRDQEIRDPGMNTLYTSHHNHISGGRLKALASGPLRRKSIPLDIIERFKAVTVAKNLYVFACILHRNEFSSF